MHRCATSRASSRSSRRDRRPSPRDRRDGSIASFVVITDPDPARRAAFIERATRAMAPMPGMLSEQLALEQTTIAWVAAASAPISQHVLPGGASVIFGDALVPGERGRVRADDIVLTTTPAVFDGYHAGIVARNADVLITTDILGLFPVYFSSVGTVRIASSSAAVFAEHPSFDAGVDLHAVIGHLLAGGPFDGRTVQHGVTRLSAGARLRWTAESTPTEEPHYRWPSTDVNPMLSFIEQRERYNEALAQAVQRHSAVHARQTLLLSGGRDSRLIAGHLALARLVPDALTLGDATDHDAICAAEVARSLRLSHRRRAVAFEPFASYVDRSLTHEQLGGGMSNLHTWAAVDALSGVGGAVISGYVFEARQIAPLPATRAGMLAWTYSHAMAPDAVRRLLVPSLHDVLNDVLASLESQFARIGDGAPDESRERSWRWLMAVYARFHPGAVPARLSHAAWPVLPILDQRFIEVMLSMPMDFLDARRMQDAVLKARFPALAELPLDQNSAEARPLVETRAYRLKTAAKRIMPATSADIERRYYARMFDFDNAGWRAIRFAAEPGRAAMFEWFDPDALAAMVPLPTARAGHADVVAQGFGPKMLTGLMRWSLLRATRPGARG